MTRYNALTAAQKDELARLCKKIYGLLEQSRREGILALEDRLGEIPAEFPNRLGGLLLILLKGLTDGWDEGVVAEVADNYAESSCADDFERLAFAMIKAGALAIQRGMNPTIEAEVLVSLVGLDDAAAFRKAASLPDLYDL